MSLISNLVPTRLRNFFTGSIPGTNQLATIADVNSVIEAVNRSNSNSYSFNTIVVNDGGLGLGLSAVGYAGGCSSPGSGCWSCLNSCGYQNANAATSFVTTAPGEYVLTVTPAPDMPRVTDINIRVGQFNVPGYVATVEKLTGTTFSIKTYNILSGTPTDPVDGLFHDTPIDIIFYFAPAYNIPVI